MQGLSLPTLPVPHSPSIIFSPCGSDDAVDAAAREQSTEAEKRPARVLVVDDAPDVLEMFGVMLRISGYDVAVAASAAEALEQASVMTFDVIVSDIGMPEMNGYELAQRLRTLPGYADVPMIAVTGFSMYKDQTQALESGFNAHLSKPVNPTTLLDLIERLRE
ncbi:MAG: response regulator [Pyrinomonadaceae bacterium]|nr:response regulator [Pyrinomonadaceae bacterium]